MSKWTANNARLHALAGELRHPDGAHAFVKELAANRFSAASLRDLTENQQNQLIKVLEAEVAAASGLAAIAEPRATKAQLHAIRVTAEHGLGWDTHRLHADMDLVYGHHKLGDLTPDDANKYIQRLNKIKRGRRGS